MSRSAQTRACGSGRMHRRVHPMFPQLLRQLVADAHARTGIAKALRTDGDACRAGMQEVERVAPGLDAAHADDRKPCARGNLRRERKRDRSHGRTGQPALPRAEPCAPVRGSIAIARSVLMRDSASAPPSSAASATGTTSETFGVSFTISGFDVSGRTRAISAAISPRSLPITHPDLTFGQETFSSSAATSARAATPSTKATNSSWEKPATLTTKGTGRPASSGRSRSRKPSRPLFGSPIELISPAGVSHRRGGGLPPRGASVIVLETNAANGSSSRAGAPNVRIAAIASHVPEPFSTGCARRRPASSTSKPLAGGGATVTPTPPPGLRPRPRARPRTAAGIRAGCARRNRSMRRSRTPCRLRARAAPVPRAPRRCAAPLPASAAARTRTPRRPASSCASSRSVTSP